MAAREYDEEDAWSESPYACPQSYAQKRVAHGYFGPIEAHVNRADFRFVRTFS